MLFLRRPAALAAALLLALLPATAGARSPCGPGAAPCAVASGTYHAVLPEGAAEGLVVFLHGGGGSGGRVVANEGLMARFTDRGYAVIAPDGLPRSPDRNGGSWNFFSNPERRDEVGFLTDILADVTTRFGLAGRPALLGGFSIGGSMTWYAACAAPELFDAYVPLAGGFWRPHPEKCAGPVRLLHTHGWRDEVVPLEGRPLWGGRIVQGDIFEGLQRWRAENACANLRADTFATDDELWRRGWQACEAGALELVLHPGGHDLAAWWADLVLDWVEGLDLP